MIGPTGRTRRGREIPDPPELIPPPAYPRDGAWTVLHAFAGLPRRGPGGAGAPMPAEFAAIAQLAALGFAAWTPARVELVSTVAGGFEWRVRALYQGYLFALIGGHVDALRRGMDQGALSAVRAVATRRDGTPLMVTGAAIWDVHGAAIRSHARVVDRISTARRGLRPGERVIISAGPFKGLDAVVAHGGVDVATIEAGANRLRMLVALDNLARVA